MWNFHALLVFHHTKISFSFFVFSYFIARLSQKLNEVILFIKELDLWGKNAMNKNTSYTADLSRHKW